MIISLINRTSVKIALFIAAICTTLLLLLNFYTTWKAQREFNAIVQWVNEQNQEYMLPQYKLRQYVIPVNQLVNERINKSINTVTIFSIISSFILGYIAARFITRPLKELNAGLRNIRQNNYKYKLKKTGTKEFDDVISEFNKLVKQLDKTESLRKNLISDTSHELKTPITSLLGQLQGVKDGVLEMDNARVDLLYNQAERLNQLVEKLQEYSTIRSKGTNLNKEDINLFNVVNDIRTMSSCNAKDKDIDININIPEDTIIKADKYLLPRIIQNLIDNAIKYSQGSKLDINYEDERIIIKDDGIGIPEKHIPYIFERFYRVDGSRSRDTGGMGLGLAIVKEIIEAHNWSINVENDRAGSGLKFTIDTKQ